MHCIRCNKNIEGLVCPCIQSVADKETVKLFIARILEEDLLVYVFEKKAFMKLPEGHLRVRPGLTACLLKTPIRSQFLSYPMRLAAAKERVTCKKCLKVLGWDALASGEAVRDQTVPFQGGRD